MKLQWKKRKLGRWILAAAVVAVVFVLFSGPDGLVGLYRTHRELAETRGELQRLHKAVDSLTLEIRRLQSDTSYIEKLARERLGMAREKETVYKFIEKKD